MAKTVLEYVLLKYPNAIITSNYFVLEKELEVGCSIEVKINGAVAKVDYTEDSPTTMNKIRDMLLVYPFITSIEYSDGLVMSFVISSTLYSDIDISVTITNAEIDVTLGDVNTYVRDAFIEVAKENTSKTWYNIKYNYAVALGACHLLALQSYNVSDTSSSSSVSGAGGQVASLQQGDLVVSYYQTGVESLSDQTDLARTPYGLELLSLRKRSNIAFGTTGGGGYFSA